uniref:Uncharacterized protein n=1 Tax=Strombidium rassoulzadegani TaxID=1082188 RepID=A0A7S3FTY1_9SPIT|mmetsp:Transcript_11836/g.20013  ORF Transcript_11836/g.20013 Transcript_11836/m.20013 type:complete len:159 (+) Transcript_11836:222-698(+)|eukprot:CAMPEP_0168617868 /NCGR_PEP_ID=MMETSP0449_2-20121227/5771_1 /TAXON_ID=1082188 /ORGANISM="Strombidium rassoulzadegani, Strain ras09" /LENGTH=158 /DNA_ID=CAMNT_0008658711 /DNA_START=208 /DNA_END=684 /DNA_ORIENTATION=-
MAPDNANYPSKYTDHKYRAMHEDSEFNPYSVQSKQSLAMIADAGDRIHHPVPYSTLNEDEGPKNILSKKSIRNIFKMPGSARKPAEHNDLEYYNPDNQKKMEYKDHPSEAKPAGWYTANRQRVMNDRKMKAPESGTYNSRFEVTSKYTGLAHAPRGFD